MNISEARRNFQQSESYTDAVNYLRLLERFGEAVCIEDLLVSYKISSKLGHNSKPWSGYEFLFGDDPHADEENRVDTIRFCVKETRIVFSGPIYWCSFIYKDKKWIEDPIGIVEFSEGKVADWISDHKKLLEDYAKSQKFQYLKSRLKNIINLERELDNKKKYFCSLVAELK